MNLSFVKRDDFTSPHELVNGSLTSGLRLAPKLKVLGTIVATVAILVMYGFMAQELAAEELFHHVTMLQNATTGKVNVSVATRMSMRRIFPSPDWTIKAAVNSKSGCVHYAILPTTRLIASTRCADSTRVFESSVGQDCGSVLHELHVMGLTKTTSKTFLLTLFDGTFAIGWVRLSHQESGAHLATLEPSDVVQSTVVSAKAAGRTSLNSAVSDWSWHSLPHCQLYQTGGRSQIVRS